MLDSISRLVGYVSVTCEEGEMETSAGDKPELNILPVVLNADLTRPYIQVGVHSVGLGSRGSWHMSV